MQTRERNLLQQFTMLEGAIKEFGGFEETFVCMLEPSFCKKQQKKSRARNWFGE